MNDNQITSLPASVGNLGVNRLLLNNNAITVLPDELCDNVEINELALNNNELTALPDCMGSMSTLIRLRLDNNQIEVYPSSLLNISTLAFVYLRNNELQNLPSGIVNMDVSDFYIGGNRLCPGNYSTAVENWLDFNEDSDPYWKTTQRCTDPVHYVQGPGTLFTLAQYAGRLEVRFAEGVRVEGVDVIGVDGRSLSDTPIPPHPQSSITQTWDTSHWDRGVYIVRAVTDRGVLLRKVVVGE